MTLPAPEGDTGGEVGVSPSRSAAPGGKAELLYKSAAVKFPTDWSHDGKYIIFYQSGEGTRLDVWGLSLADKHAAPILDTVYTEGFATLSPNGKWLAYQLAQGERHEVYIQAFDGLTSLVGTGYDMGIINDGCQRAT